MAVLTAVTGLPAPRADLTLPPLVSPGDGRYSSLALRAARAWHKGGARSQHRDEQCVRGPITAGHSADPKHDNRTFLMDNVGAAIT